MTIRITLIPHIGANTMTANVNPETGIRYGVIDARNVPDLYDEIITSGDNLAYECAVKELRDDIQSAIDDADTIDDLVSDLGRIASNHTSDSHAKEIVADLDSDKYDDIDSFRDDIDIDYLVERLSEYWEFDECEYSYTDNEGRYLLGYLGGAPLIWVLESKYTTYARLCSPCVPNAGNLDHRTTEDDGYLCYSLDPEFLDQQSKQLEEWARWRPSN